MEQHELLLKQIRDAIRNLESFLNGMKEASLKPPMPTRVLYTTPDVFTNVRQLVESLSRNTLELEKEIDDLQDELSDYYLDE